MENSATGIDRMRSYLVMAATIGVIVFNWLAATGRLGSDTAEISAKYPTLVTPAGYAFTIWTLIYVGMIAFSIYQMLPANLARFRAVRSLYILSCALNCAWLYFWHRDQIVVCLAMIVALAITLIAICYQLREPESLSDFWIAKAPFGLYGGWVTSATLVNFAITLKYLKVEISGSAEIAVAVALIVIAAFIAIIVRVRFREYMFPLAVGWALTAIGVKQSGNTLVVVATAVGLIACLIASISFVMHREPSKTVHPV